MGWQWLLLSLFNCWALTLLFNAYFYQLSNLYWCIWGIIQARYSTIDFDYMEYAQERLEWYYEMKTAYGFDNL